MYHSKAAKTQNVTISFPMPEVPLDDGPDTEDLFMNDKIPDIRNYMNFAVKVDGQPVKTRIAERALFKGKDVTARLQRAGVPLLLVKDRQERLARVSEANKDALVKEGLLSKFEANGFYSTNWDYQVLFEWEQSFKPGPTKVDVSYRPIAGDSTDFGDYYNTGEGVKKYCVDPALRAAIATAPRGVRAGADRLRAEDRALLERPDRKIPPGGRQGQRQEPGGVLSGQEQEDLRHAVRMDGDEFRAGQGHRGGDFFGGRGRALNRVIAACSPRGGDCRKGRRR